MKRFMLVAASLAASVALIAPKLSVQAQPAATNQADAPKVKLRAIDVIDLEEMMNTKIDVAVVDATLLETLQTICKTNLFNTRIEVRQPGLNKITLSMKDVEVSNVLRIAAEKVGCEVFVLFDRILIAPQSALRAEEKNFSNEKLRPAMEKSGFLAAATQALLENQQSKAAYGALDEHTKKILQRLVDITLPRQNSAKVVLSADALVSVTKVSNGVELKIDLASAKRQFVWVHFIN